jgi:hypothetical protein
MYRLDYSSMIAKDHHVHLLKEAENYRLLEAAFKKNTKPNRISQFIALVGEKLVAMGDLLVLRYGRPPEPNTTLNPQPTLDGCT